MWGVLCVAPAVLGFLLWQLGPILGSFYIALTDWRIAGTPNWIGFENFRQIFTEDRLFRKSLGVTTYYSLGSVPLRMLLAFALAVLLNQKIRALPIFRTIFYLPSIVPLIASSVLWIWLFNPDFGLLNAILRPLGFPKLQWIYGSDSVIPALILMSLWDIGPMMIIFLAGLQGVPRQLYEAVEIDGGNPWHKMRHITIPMVTPTILFNLILSIIGTMQTFRAALRDDRGRAQQLEPALCSLPLQQGLRTESDGLRLGARLDPVCSDCHPQYLRVPHLIPLGLLRRQVSEWLPPSPRDAPWGARPGPGSARVSSTSCCCPEAWRCSSPSCG